MCLFICEHNRFFKSSCAFSSTNTFLKRLIRLLIGSTHYLTARFKRPRFFHTLWKHCHNNTENEIHEVIGLQYHCAGNDASCNAQYYLKERTLCTREKTALRTVSVENKSGLGIRLIGEITINKRHHVIYKVIDWLINRYLLRDRILLNAEKSLLQLKAETQHILTKLRGSFNS